METKNLLNKKITQWLLLVAMLLGCSANALATNEFGQRYFYVDCTDFTSYPSVNCSFFWGNDDTGSCDNEAGYKKGMATCATNVYYHDLSTVSSGSYTYLRGFQVSQGDWSDKSCHVPASSGNKKNCVKITGWGKGDWSTYVLTPSAVKLEVTDASSGSGTISDPYIVAPEATFTLKAYDVTYSPSDPNMSTRYGFGTTASSSPTGTSSTSNQTASSSEETKQYYVSVRGYYNSTYSSSYKSTSVYVQTVNPCTTPTKAQYTMASGQSVTYTGSAQAPTITVASGAGSITKIYGSTDSGSTWTDYGTSGPTNAGTYKIKIDCGAGSTYCASTSSIVLDNTFTINKIDQSALTFNGSTQCVGTNVTLSASGGTTSETITYKVKSGSGAISGTTLSASTAGTVVVTATRPGGINYNDATADASFVFNAAPTAGTISGDPVCKGSKVTLTVTNPSSASVQWQNSSKEDISGATSTSYTTPALQESTDYYVKFTKGGCSSTSSKGTATVKSASLSITATPTTVNPYIPVTLTAKNQSGTETNSDWTITGTGSYFTESDNPTNVSTVVMKPAKAVETTVTATATVDGCSVLDTYSVTPTPDTETCN